MVQVQLKIRLQLRSRKSASECMAALQQQAQTFMTGGYKPSTAVETLPAGSWYLDDVDEQCRRMYKRRPAECITGQPAS